MPTVACQEMARFSPRNTGPRMRETKASQRRLQEGKRHPWCHRHWHRPSQARFSPEPSASPISHQANLAGDARQTRCTEDGNHRTKDKAEKNRASRSHFLPRSDGIHKGCGSNSKGHVARRRASL
jgi:hypothetical protein